MKAAHFNQEHSVEVWHLCYHYMYIMQHQRVAAALTCTQLHFRCPPPPKPPRALLQGAHYRIKLPTAKLHKGSLLSGLPFQEAGSEGH